MTTSSGRLLTLFLLTILSSVMRADLLCSAGGNNGCAWHCGLSGRGGGSCDESTDGDNSEEPKDVESPANTVTKEKTCSCQPSNPPVVTNDYFSLELDQITNSTQASGLPNFIQKVVFFQLVRSYLFRTRESLLKPDSYGLERATNFYIQGQDKEDILGAWFMWPEGGHERPRELPQDSTLVVYFHGNSQDRGFGHRVSLYEMLLGQGLHVLAIDYRSFGDSSRVPLTEQTVVDDGLAVLDWVKSELGDSSAQVIVWGHSLGTSIATRALVASNFTQVSGLVLESPFNTMEDEVKKFKTARFAAWIGGLDIKEELEKANVEFRTESWLPQVTQPVLVLHSDDDPIVPAYLGQRLVERTKEAGKEDIQLVRFGKGNRLRHRYIYRAPGIKEYLDNFLQLVKTKKVTP